MENTVQTVKKKGRFHIPLERKRQLVGYWFCLPVILGFFCIFIPGMVSTFVFSFSEVQFNPDTIEMETVFVGFTNYIKMFDSTDFIIPLTTCLKDMAINVPVIVLFSFFLAILLNRKNFPGRTFFRVIFFLPVIMDSGAAATAGADSISQYSGFGFDSANSGMTSSVASQFANVLNIQAFLEQLTFSTFIMDFVLKSVDRLSTTINGCGIQVIIFLGALQGVSPSVFEAAEVEGLSAWELFWKITLPLISPMILVNLVYTAIDSFGANDEILEQIQKTWYTLNQPGAGAAMTVFYFLCSTLIVLVIVGIVSRVVFYEE